jgi:hypothetical protein
VARTEQWINLPRPPAVVEIVLEAAEPGRRRLARLAWQSRTSDRPTSISLTLDGEPLTLDSQNRAVIPRAPRSGATRVLSAEVQFANFIVARKDVALGGQYGDEVATELTAVPVKLRKGAELPPVARLAGWFAADGKPLRATAVEAGPAHLQAVRAPGAVDRLFYLFWHRLAHRRFLLQRGSRVRFLATTAKTYSGAGMSFELFDGSQDFDASEQGLPYLLAAVIEPKQEGRASRVADAVAVAGLQATDGAGPRAVLLILPGGGGEDKSRYSAKAVRRYLAALHVPLFVWSAGLPSDATLAAWGTVEDVSTPRRLEQAFRSLKQELDAQRVVLLEGRHLPQSIVLAAPAAADVAALP